MERLRAPRSSRRRRGTGSACRSTWRTESAAPPRASPSALVRMTPVRSSAALKLCAARTASWPAMLSTTNRRSVAPTARSIACTSSIIAVVDVQAARGVDDHDVVLVAARMVERRGRDRDRRRVRGRREVVRPDLRRRAARAASSRPGDRRRCSRAAASAAGFSMRWRASFAAVVVLPAPCRPASSTTTGGVACRLSPRPGSPMTRVSSSWMTPMNAWPGVRLSHHLGADRARARRIGEGLHDRRPRRPPRAAPCAPGAACPRCSPRSGGRAREANPRPCRAGRLSMSNIGNLGRAAEAAVRSRGL